MKNILRYIKGGNISKISYIIPTKNRSDVIKDTIESLMNQTVSDWETVIVNDHGDQDLIEKTVSSYNDSRLKLYHLEGDQTGASYARNFAILQAESEIVAILDDDDMAYPERTKLTIEAFEDKNVDVVYGNIDIFDQEKNEIRERKTPVVAFDLILFKEKDFIPHSTLAVRKTLLLANPYNSYFLIAEDYDLLSRLAIQNKNFKYIDEKLLKYRLWPNNITNADRKNLAQDYTLLVQMCRGWKQWDKDVLDRINQSK